MTDLDRRGYAGMVVGRQDKRIVELEQELAARGRRAGEAAAVGTGVPPPPDVPPPINPSDTLAFLQACLEDADAAMGDLPPLTGPKPSPAGYSAFRGPSTIEEAVRGAAQPPNEYDPHVAPHDGGPSGAAIWAILTMLGVAVAFTGWILWSHL